MKFVIINNQLIEAEKAQISIQDRGFRFGDGVFETIPVLAGVPYQFDWHVERLRKGLHAIRINCNLHTLNEQCRKLLKENAVADGILRIQVTRGIGSIGYLPDSDHPQAGATIVIETLPMPKVPTQDISLWLSSYRKITPSSLPVQYKLCQGLNSTLARIEAQEQQCYEALLINHAEELCETASGNLFWFKDETIYTPALSCGALEGSMRASVMRLSPYPVQEVKENAEALKDAQEVFITNAVWKVLNVKELKPAQMRWDTRKVTDNLQKRIADDMADYSKNNATRWS